VGSRAVADYFALKSPLPGSSARQAAAVTMAIVATTLTKLHDRQEDTGVSATAP
jgi:hypothetical protein